MTVTHPEFGKGKMREVTMSEAMIGLLAAVVGAAIGAASTFFAQRQVFLMNDCRRAVRDLKRFRDLEDIWAEELAAQKGGGVTPESERLRMRKKLTEGIGQFGERRKIERLIERLD
jgi:hypothetical protein